MTEPSTDRPGPDSTNSLSAVEIVMMTASLIAIAALTIMVVAAL